MTEQQTIADLQTEAGVLGLCLIAPAAASQLIAWGVDEQCFYHDGHRRMWQAIVQLSADQEEISAEQVARAMTDGPDAGQDDVVLVHRVSGATAPVGGLQNDAEHLRTMARRRRWREIGWLAHEAADTGDETLIGEVEKLLTTREKSDDTITALDLGVRTIGWLADTEPVGISTGLHELDLAIGGGWRPGDMTVLAAYSGIGKSTLLDTMLTTAARAGHDVHVYVNEMNAVDRALRMIARETTIPAWRLLRRQLRDNEIAMSQRAAAKLPFGITDCSQWTAERIARHARASRWAVWAVDLVSNMLHRDEQELSQIINTLASAARNTGSHCILITQLNRARNVGDTLPRPVARDIRGSGMFEAQSRNVLMLHRPQTVNGHGDTKEIVTENEGAVYVEKATHGQRGAVVEVVFNANRMSFTATEGAAA